MGTFVIGIKPEQVMVPNTGKTITESCFVCAWINVRKLRKGLLKHLPTDFGMQHTLFQSDAPFYACLQLFDLV
jgi:hypothetical protein